MVKKIFKKSFSLHLTGNVFRDDITGIIGYLINYGLVFFEEKKIYWGGK